MSPTARLAGDINASPEANGAHAFFDRLSGRESQSRDEDEGAAEPVGAVYLRREQGSRDVQALSATCPHAGCFVEMESTGRSFRCPCHNSCFSLDGGIVNPSPSPRRMDSLECRVGDTGTVAVKWQKFRAGVAAKEVQG